MNYFFLRVYRDPVPRQTVYADAVQMKIFGIFLMLSDQKFFIIKQPNLQEKVVFNIDNIVDFPHRHDFVFLSNFMTSYKKVSIQIEKLIRVTITQKKLFNICFTSCVNSH